MSGSHRPSSSQALYFVAATVQQLSHRKCLCGPLLAYYACVDIAYACVCSVCYERVCCVRVCGFICELARWHPPHCSFLFYFVCSAYCLLRRIISVSHHASSSRALYFVAATVQQQPHNKFVRINAMRVLALHMRLCVICVCYDTQTCGMCYYY